MYKSLSITHDIWEAIYDQFEQRLNIANLLATWMEETLLLNLSINFGCVSSN